MISTGRLVQALGGRGVLRERQATFEAIIAKARTGFPYAALEALATRFEIPPEALLRVLHLPPRTLARRKKARRLDPAGHPGRLHLGEPRAGCPRTLRQSRAAAPAGRPGRDLGRHSRDAHHLPGAASRASTELEELPPTGSARRPGNPLGARVEKSGARRALGRYSSGAELLAQSPALRFQTHPGRQARGLPLRSAAAAPLSPAPSDRDPWPTVLTAAPAGASPRPGGRRSRALGGRDRRAPMPSISRAAAGLRLPLVTWDKEQRARAARLVEPGLRGASSGLECRRAVREGHLRARHGHPLPDHLRLELPLPTVRHGWVGLPGLRDVGDERFGREQQGRDRRGILQGDALDLGRVDDPRLHHVDILVGLGVEAVRDG